MVYVQLFGVFDFNEILIAPLGTKVILHDIPNKCDTWSKHGLEGCYICPEL